ncbi:MAG: DNA double-strand break repair nuclease NurA [Chloroflexi bacterium]|nr:DNA double-strand break repair nuclease NurA [Chloroflexota bacterium]
MSLDLSATLVQVEAAVRDLRALGTERDARLAQALKVMAEAEGAAVNDRRSAGRVTWLVPTVPPSLVARVSPPPPPSSYRALAVDGSHIDVDRHLPVRCALVNVSKVALQYGPHPDARLESRPRLYAAPEELSVADPEGVGEQPLEGQLLGIKRAVEEVVALAELAEEAAADGTPAVALVDGSLILWGLAGQAYPEYVRKALIQEGLVPALDRLQSVARQRPLAVAGYTSLPRATEVVNALRLRVCPFSPVDCDRHCAGTRQGHRPCDDVGGLLDRELFRRLLEPGERSAIFASNSSVVRNHYGQNAIHFYYLNVGEEVARVEVPAWVASDEQSLSLSHSLILDQGLKGRGYPAAIMEAHEQAVISGPERELFRQMVEEALARRRLDVYTSEKARSKRLRWV